MKHLVHVVVTAVALLLAALLVPGIEIAWGDDALVIVISLVTLGAVLAVVNASVGRILRIVSLPLNLLTLGFFAVVIDAALLLLVAFLVDAAWQPLLVIGGFPPELTFEAVGAAALGAFIITLVTTLIERLTPGL
jgi:putative membrane protein